MTEPVVRTATAKPIKATFVQWTGDNLKEVRDFMRDEYFNHTVDGVIIVMFKDTKLIQPVYQGWYIARYDGTDCIRVISKHSFDWLFQVD